MIAQCKAGIVGAFPALNARPIFQLDEWLHEIIEALSAHDRAHPESPAAPFERWLDRLNSIRRSGESYSEGIIRLAALREGHWTHKRTTNQRLSRAGKGRSSL